MPAIHVVGLPHMPDSGGYCVCAAFARKTRLFADLIEDAGYTVHRHYNLTAVEPDPGDPNHLHWDNHDEWQEANNTAITAVRAAGEPRDFVAVVAGSAQQPLETALPGMMVVEYGVGYPGTFAKYRCYESRAWMHHNYGARGDIGRPFDTVVPAFFDPDLYNPEQPREDWLLYLGRLTERKGVHEAAAIAEAAGRELKVIGWGDTPPAGSHVTLLGALPDQAVRDHLARAHAVLCPTVYVEPFGSVAVEAMLSGAPVVASDWGGFTDTVPANQRFSTLSGALEALTAATSIPAAQHREYAESRFTPAAVTPAYVEWFQRLETLWGDGWYAQ